MKPFLLFAFSALLFTGCTTAYKTGQTPDDVYYSPTRPQEEYVETDKEEKKEYRYDDEYYDDRYLRMKVRNRYRWSDLDEWYGYDRYSLGYNYVFASYNNPYNSWHYFNNPYCCCKNNILVVNGKNPPPALVVKRHFNLAGYTNTNYNNTNTSGNIKTPVRSNNSRTIYNNTNNNTNNSSDGLSNKVRTIFSGDNSGSGSNRTYTPSTSNSSSSSGNNNSSSGGSRSSNSSSSGAVSRPTRN